MKQSVRTFIAVEVSEAVRAAAAKVIRQLARCDASIRWVEPENMHLTLKFLGEVETIELPDICRAVEAAAAEVQGFTFDVAGVGAFPKPDRPRTIWLGVTAGVEQLEHLQKQIEKGLKRLGYPPENRRFSPHLTLGRVKQPGPQLDELAELIRSLSERSAGTTEVDEVTVFSSELTREGPIYQPMAHASLS
ncbi:MAG: RNA 2',3'-cyclic phosphodiesterase [Thermoguttaceae bacterium]